MAQVKIKENVYFQQMGNFVYGVYVNEEFIRVVVKKELTETELLELGTQLYSICEDNENIKSVINSYSEEYKLNPSRDGSLIYLTSNDNI